MIDNFEHQESNWVIVKPLNFTIRFIKFSDGLNKARGFIPTLNCLKGRKLSLTFRIRMIIVSSSKKGR
jgi:hypothetical protein